MKKFFSKINKYLFALNLLLISILLSISLYFNYRFSSTNFEEIIFYAKNGMDATDPSVFIDGTRFCIPIVILLFLIFLFIFYGISLNKIIKFKINPLTFFKKYKTKVLIFLTIYSLIALLNGLNFFGYIKYINTNSKFIENNYVDPKTTEIKFDEKRNLIIIFVESMETSLFTKENGGYWDYDVIQGLNNLINDTDAAYFYNENKAQASNMIGGSSWTTASIVSNQSGLPFKIRISKNGYHSENFMNGSYTLGDLLKDNGYYNEVISSATTSFGGVYEFYKKHGDFEIVDMDTLDKYDLSMNNSDIGKWGFNDNYLFETAKKRLNIISKQKEPFDLQLITIDTHFTDGFIGDYSERKYEEKYENAYATESNLIYEFINWLKKQPYYNNTTVLIVGDHLSMQNDFFKKRKANERYVYNCIINPRDKTAKFNNRIFTSLDMYPTILYSIGANISGNRLGLGVNLFSEEQTLAEEYGVRYLDKELLKNSKYYNNYILDDNYVTNIFY